MERQQGRKATQVLIEIVLSEEESLLSGGRCLSGLQESIESFGQSVVGSFLFCAQSVGVSALCQVGFFKRVLLKIEKLHSKLTGWCFGTSISEVFVSGIPNCTVSIVKFAPFKGL